MEMESGSRRSIDRSREPGGPGLKKPRLADELASNGVVVDRNRPRVPPGAGTLPPRFRGNEREREQQQQPPQQNHQELVSQYKTALAELTFNSKPIITNLTIIAGENLHVAKWIAAAVCTNILEVPSDQKLPSLYLLDSIVKNIGRDYIKYFAARLPEVFCKAYRQVDSSIHSGMRHLFGTWKGVFPLNCLQMIEKELGIAPASNGSSSGATTSRPESQSQRPPQSIHVNPKYLEARRFQQSIKVKAGNANTVPIVPSAEDAERPDRTAIGSERAWPDLPMKIHDFKHPQREASESVLEKNSAEYEDSEYNSDLPGYSNLGYGRTSEKVSELDKRDKPWYGVEKTAAESMVGKGNAFDTQHGLSKYRASRPALPTDPRLPMGSAQRNASSGRGMNENWKNSEEEEYTWDDMSSRLTDRGIRDSLRKDVWTPDDAEKLDFDDHLSQPRGELDAGMRISRESSIDSLSIPQRGQTAFGNSTPSVWPLRETSARDGLKHTGVTSRISGLPESHPTSVSGSTLARTGLQNLTGSSITGAPSFGSLGKTSSGILGQQRHQPSSTIHRPQSPSAFPHHHESHNLIEEDHLPARSIPQFGSKLSHSVPQLNRTPPHETSQNSFPILSQNHIQSGSLQTFNSQSSQHLPTSFSLMQFSQRRAPSPFSLQPFPELTPSQHSGITQKPVPQSSSLGAPPVISHSVSPPVISHSVSSHTASPAADIPGQSSTSSLLAAIAKSGLLSNNSFSGGLPDQKFQESQVHDHPSLPSGIPPLVPTSFTSVATPASVLDSASTLSLTNPKKTSALPPLPPGPPPPSSVTGTSTSTSNVANAAANPLSGLLSSLVAKGLISTPAKESPTPPASQVSSLLKNRSPGLTTSSSTPVSSRSAPSASPKTFSGNECPLPESAAKSTAATCSPATNGETETKDLIGIVFKPEIIRQSHPSVISGLFEDLPHQCNICAFRVKLKEQLDQHLEWHASRKAELSNCGTVSRRWYASSGDWVTGNVNFSSGSISTSSEGALIEMLEQNEPSVPADENQCICLLCGELFEDVYSHGRDEWMFKGTIYMPIPAVVSGIQATDNGTLQGPIVHAKCISPSSVEDLGLVKSVKQEPMDE